MNQGKIHSPLASLHPTKDPNAFNGACVMPVLQDEVSAAEAYKTVYIESYGCQMNFSDSEIVASILQEVDYRVVGNIELADLVLINTCSIREKAEQTIRKRLTEINKLKEKRPEMLVGVLGCMAERMKHQLLEQEKIVDVVVGPDAYRSLPLLVKQAEEGHKSINVLLSREETYADIAPVRLDSNGVSAFVSIMRGCNNMCSFCVVPFTRGRERSRATSSILEECQTLVSKGYKEVTLLGQNVDSYCYQKEDGATTNFAQLLAKVAEVDATLRVRFSTSHPKDITDEVLHTMKRYDNICKYIHLPVQSGSTTVLERMNRKYTREWYMDKIARIRAILPECAVSTDLIAGFCGETEAEHQETLSLMEFCRYDYAYMFMYSERPNTPAAKQLKDDVPHETKRRRLAEIVALQREHSLARMQACVGTYQHILVEGCSKRSEEKWIGRNPQNQVALFDAPKEGAFARGAYLKVKITDCTSATLFAEIV